jgi:hypothetical protein
MLRANLSVHLTTRPPCMWRVAPFKVLRVLNNSVCVGTGIPAFVDLTFDLASLHVDTHVLMTLAVLGTLAIGGALEVCSRTISHLTAVHRCDVPRRLREQPHCTCSWRASVRALACKRILGPPAGLSLTRFAVACVCRGRCCWCCSRCRTPWSTGSRTAPRAACRRCSTASPSRRRWWSLAPTASRTWTGSGRSRRAMWCWGRPCSSSPASRCGLTPGLRIPWDPKQLAQVAAPQTFIVGWH